MRLILVIGLLTTLYSCCPFIKEEHLGNNVYLSEYDNVDRQILYSEETCSGSGVQIVPMTILAYNYNSEWIIAKSGNKREKPNYEYWIIKNSYDNEPTPDLIKLNTTGPLNESLFLQELKSKKIYLKLEKIDD